MRVLESFQCSAADDDVDGDPDHHDGGDAGDAQVYVDADADAGDDGSRTKGFQTCARCLATLRECRG